VLSVSLSSAASKLSALARQHGGANAFSRASSSARPPDSGSGIITTVSLDDLVPTDVMARLASIMAEELGPLARIGIQRLVKRDGAPSFRSFRQFADRIAALAGSDPAQRSRLVDSAMRLIPALGDAHTLPSLPEARGAEPPAASTAALRSSYASQRTVAWAPAAEQRASDVISEPSIEVGEPVEIAELDSAELESEPKKLVKKKRTYVYRGKVYTVDD